MSFLTYKPLGIIGGRYTWVLRYSDCRAGMSSRAIRMLKDPKKNPAQISLRGKYVKVVTTSSSNARLFPYLSDSM